MNYATFARICATLGPIGYLPAPGTMATAVTVLFLYSFGLFGMRTGALVWVVVPLIGIGALIIHRALLTGDRTDPSEIVLDEVLGYCLAQSIFPLTAPWLISSAFVFRFFDILKPLGIRRCEKLPGTTGVICDDLLAGFYTQIVIVIARIGIEVWLGY